MTLTYHVGTGVASFAAGIIFCANLYIGFTWNDDKLADLRPFYLSFTDGNCPKGTELAYALYADGEARRFCAQIRPKVKL